ncbi:MAG: hypothetical protein R3C71_06885 [Candidatus Krumholzibacteriia bacterium]|nr:hypothetical protein [Candidatus Latescibacterota bacterium]
MTPILARDAYRTRPGVWTLALALALLLHAGAIVGVKRLHLASARPLPEEEPPPLEFVFAPEPADTPRQFTELPEDRADTPPERADLLSNVASRARDLTPGGEDAARPRSDGRADFPQVAMDTGAPSAPAPAGQPMPAEPSEESPRGALPRRGTPATENPLDAYRRLDPSTAREQQPPSPRAGASDVHQEAMASPDGNVKLLGDVSLSTSAWVYGYWMQRFRRAVESHWNAPYAFKIGMIKGWTLVGLEVARTGELLKVEVLDEEGHYTLRDASVAAIQAAAPFEPLPPDAPEQTLRLQIRMIYTDYGH